MKTANEATQHKVTPLILFERADSMYEKIKDLPAQTYIDRIFLQYRRQVLEKLTTILKEKKDPTEIAAELKTMLSNNWELINGNLLSYTALPNDDLTLLLADVAEFTANNLEKKELCALELLMPTVNIEHVTMDDSQNLNKTPLKTVLKTHILGEDGRYLIPIEQLKDLYNKEGEFQDTNWYAPFDSHDKYTTITRDDQNRLMTHSKYTEAISTAYSDYEMVLNKQDNLLAQLEKLCNSLYINSKNVKGSELVAGNDVYAPIVLFFDYYDKLTAEIKEKIPSNLKKEIDLLRNVGANSKLGDINTCVALRRQDLQKAMQQARNLDTCIGLTH